MPAVTGNITYYAVWCNTSAGSSGWVETALADLTTDDVFVLSTGTYAATNNNGTNSAPAATAITVSAGKITSPATIPDNLKWNISGNATDGYVFYPNGSTTTWLYCNTTNSSGSNNNIRVGTGERKVWKPNNTGYLVTNDANTARYLSIYGSQDFRSYVNTDNGVFVPKCYKYSESGGSTDFITTCCDEVDRPDVTVEIHATYVTLKWEKQGTATYTVTCTGGSVGSTTGDDTKSCTITGLTAETSYSYTVTVSGATCSQTASGHFTTADCDDVPSVASAVATTTTVTFSWSCTSNNSTIYIYSEETCVHVVRSKATTHTTTAKTDTISNLESGVTYYYKIKSNNTCSSAVGSFTTLVSQITIAEWDTCGVYLDLGDIEGAVAIVENQNTQATVTQNYADSLFFSKYFEAASNVKLLAIFNGTDHNIDAGSYQIWLASAGMDDKSGYKDWAKKKTLSEALTTPELRIMKPGEERILITYQNNNSADSAIIKCAKENPNSGYDSYIRVNWFDFNGNDAIALVNPQGNLIDLIGAGTKTNTYLGPDASHGMIYYTDAAAADFMDKPGGWMTTEGINFETEEEHYTLSTNRCLLVRLNTVVSGLTAVAENTTDFKTLGRYVNSSSVEVPGEWKGVQIPGESGSKTSPGVLAACAGFEDVGKYDYNGYYATYDTIIKNIELDDIRQPDGTYYIHITDLDTMSCTNLRIVVTTKEGEKLTGTWKIPIFVTDDKATVQTDDVVFTKEGEDCATCDVVVLRDANLQVVTDGMNTIRNIEIYPSATLDIPTGKTYNINSLIVRSKDDTVSRVNAIGTLTPTIKNVYLDKRITATRVYKFSLPYACTIADVKWRSGDKATYGTDWILRWYDGDRRANGTQGGNWKTFTGSTIQPGVGYDLVINSDVLEDGNKYAELRFPMAIDGANITSPATVTVPVKAYGANNSRTKDGQPVTPNHLGWNLIGNPYLNDYKKDNMPDDLTEGALSIVDNKYTLTENGLRYLVVPTYAGSTTYQQVNMALTDMDPFTAYFVQIDGASDNQELNVVFSLSNVAGRSAIRRRVEAQEYEEDNHIVWYAIDLNNESGKKDETTLLISNRFTDKFEMMDDMHKIRNAGQSIIATQNNDGEMVFNALPDSSAAVKGVPVNYYAAEAGNYTISTSGNYSLEEVKEAWLFDKTNGRYTDLLTENYSFATAAGDNTERFILYVRVERKKAPEVATGNDNILANGKLNLVTIDKTLVLSGLTSDADVYVYDISGKLLTGERANGNGIWRATVPATGVYFVRVNSINGQQTLRTIVK